MICILGQPAGHGLSGNKGVQDCIAAATITAPAMLVIASPQSLCEPAIAAPDTDVGTAVVTANGVTGIMAAAL